MAYRTWFAAFIFGLITTQFAYSAQPFVFGREDVTVKGGSAFAMADFNGDGNPDLVVVNYNDSSISVFLGSSDGSFSWSADYAVGNYPTAVTVGDFTGNGKPDIAVVNNNCQGTCGQGTISVLLNQGNGTFSSAVSYNTGSDPIAIVAADFNGDGKLDLAVANAINPTQAGPGTVSVFINAGKGKFKLGKQYNAGSGIVQMSVIGTNKPSLAVTNFTAMNGINAVAVLRNNGNGTFAKPVSYQTGLAPFSVASADFNGDGITDLAVTNSASNSVSVFLGNTDGTFQPKVDYPVDFGPNRVAAADLRGNGKSDLVVSAGTSTPGGGSLSVLLGNGDGTFQPDVVYGTGNNPLGIIPGDFNHDGKSDVAFMNGNFPQISFILGNGDGTLYVPAHYSAASVPVATALGDFNGDGINDMAVLDAKTGDVSILFGKADGTFVRHQTLHVGKNPSAVVAGDFNGDGRPDLAITNSGNNTVTILLNSGAGKFTLGATLPVGNSPSSLIAVDLNGDSKLDLAVTNLVDSTVSILLGNGDGTFQPQKTYSTNAGPSSIVAADFNGDGKLDLAVADSFTPLTPQDQGLVSVLYGNGDGTFGTNVDFGIGSASPSAVVAGDFNHDGNQDLAVASTLDIFGHVTILSSDGSGGFPSQVDYQQEFILSSMVAADFNGDGNLDLAIACPYNNTAFILKGMGDGTFQMQGSYAAGAVPASVVAGQIGKTGPPGSPADLVVTNQTDGTVSVFMNSGN